MMEAFKGLIVNLGLEKIVKDKVFGLTTDGENANTGRKAGLWVEMEKFLGHGLMTIWCIAHRSDLAIESLSSSLPEYNRWMADVKGIATWYRASARRFEDLDLIAQESDNRAIKFPKHHEVRFAEHQSKLVNSIVKNRDHIVNHMKRLSEDPANTREEKVVRNQAAGFLRAWDDGSFNTKFSHLMLDILERYKDIQMEAQRSRVTIPDVLLKRDRSITALELMKKEKFPGGAEEKLPNIVEDDSSASKRRKITHAYVAVERCYKTVRLEAISAAQNFMDDRLSGDADGVVKAIEGMANAKNAAEMLTAGRGCVENLFGDDEVASFANDTIDFFLKNGARQFAPHESITAKMYELLKMSVPNTVLKKLVQVMIAVCPHSMITERVISCYTEVKGKYRSSMSRDTVNKRLIVALNSAGTANFDPRPAVASFMVARQRRQRLADEGTYSEREFVRKFFSTDNNM